MHHVIAPDFVAEDMGNRFHANPKWGGRTAASIAHVRTCEISNDHEMQ
jgi:hypothetical protein